MDAGSWNGYIQQYISEAKKDLENLKKITDPEKLCSEGNFSYSKHSTRFVTMSSHYYSEKLGEKGASGSELSKYSTLVNKLKELYQKSLEDWNKTQEQQEKKQKENQIKEEIRQREARKSHCVQCGKKSLVYHYIYNEKTKQLTQSYSNATDSNNEWVFCTTEHFDRWWKNNYFQCSECGKEYIGERWIYSIQKNDGKKFCEDNDKTCFLNHYAETCNKCFQKCLKYKNSKPVAFESYYNDAKNKTGNLCFNCNERKIKKEKEKLEKELARIAEQEAEWKRKLAEIERKLVEDNQRKKEQEKQQRHCLDCSTKLIGSEVDYCFSCDWKKKNKADSSNVIEREREREQKPQAGQTQHTHTHKSNPLNQINNLFSNFLQKTQSIYGENSPITQNLTKEQAKTISVLEKASEDEQKEYLSLISKLQPLLEKMPNLNPEEQTKLMNLGQELESLEKNLKEKQIRSEEKSNRNKLILGIGCGVLGLGLIGLVVWLIFRRKKKYG